MPASPVVILTTSLNDPDVETAYRIHAECHIAKPVGPKGFTTVVHSIDEFWFGAVRALGKEK